VARVPKRRVPAGREHTRQHLVVARPAGSGSLVGLPVGEASGHAGGTRRVAELGEKRGGRRRVCLHDFTDDKVRDRLIHVLERRDRSHAETRLVHNRQ
jgi:hypothetical protein